MALNGRQRARWLSDMISETQRYLSKSQGSPETPLVQRALEALNDARTKANRDTSSIDHTEP